MPTIPRRDSDLRSHRKKAKVLTVKLAEKLEPPALPDIEGREWHAMTKAWWSDSTTGLWASPMAAEFAKSDLHGLIRVAMLVDGLFKEETPRGRAQLSAEVRLASAAFGLDPIARRRPGWRIDTPPKKESSVLRFLPKRDPRDYFGTPAGRA